MGVCSLLSMSESCWGAGLVHPDARTGCCAAAAQGHVQTSACLLVWSRTLLVVPALAGQTVRLRLPGHG